MAMRHRAFRKAAVRAAAFLLLGAVVNVAVAWGCSWWSVPVYVESFVIHRSQWPAHLVPSHVESLHIASRWRGFGVDETSIIGIPLKTLKYLVPSDDRVVFAPPRPLNEQRLLAERLIEDVRNTYSAGGGTVARRQWLFSQFDGDLHVMAGWPFRSVEGWVPRTSRAYRGPSIQQEGLSLTSIRCSIAAACLEHMPEGSVIAGFRKIEGIWVARGLPYRLKWPSFAINSVFYALILWLLFLAPFAARRMLRRRRRFRGLCEKCAYPIGVSPVCTECGAAVSRRQEG